MSLADLLARRARDDLDPEVVDSGELRAVVALHGVQRCELLADALLECAQRRKQVLERRSGQLGGRDRAGDGVDVDADRRCPEARALDGLGPAADERVEDGDSLKVPCLVVRLPEVGRRLRDRADEHGAERAPEAPCEPLVDLVDRARAASFSSGECHERRERKSSSLQECAFREARVKRYVGHEVSEES